MKKTCGGVLHYAEGTGDLQSQDYLVTSQARLPFGQSATSHFVQVARAHD